MRDDYYNFLKERGLTDIFTSLDFPYSKKLKYIKELHNEYGSSALNRALTMYKENYIDLNRVNEYALLNQIKYFCKKLK